MSSPVSVQSLDQDVEILDEWVGLGEQIARLEAQRAKLVSDRVELLLGVAPVHQQMAIRCTIAEFAAAGHVAQGTVERAFGWCWKTVALRLPMRMDATTSKDWSPEPTWHKP